jgi:Spy/CpxP family protein refolding chaperone
MKRKVMMAMMLAALTAVPVFAATTDQDQVSNEGYNQMFNNHKQMIQQVVDSGSMTAAQAVQMNDHMQQMMQSNDKMNSNMSDNCGRMGNSNSNK